MLALNMLSASGTHIPQAASSNTPTGFVVKLTSDGEHVWSNDFDISNFDGNSSSIVNDIVARNDAVFICGDFSGMIQYSGGGKEISPILFKSKAENNTDDMFVSKLDSAGNEVWINHGGGPSQGPDLLPAHDESNFSLEDTATSIAVDGAGNVYVAGRISGKIDREIGKDQALGQFFDHEEDIVVASGENAAQNYFAGTPTWFVAKFVSSDGKNIHINFERDNWLDDNSRQNTYSMANDLVFSGGFLYVAGEVYGFLENFRIGERITPVFRFDSPKPNNAITDSEAIKLTDGFILKLDTDLEFQSVEGVIGDRADRVQNLAGDLDGNVYAIGTYGQPSVAFTAKPGDSESLIVLPTVNDANIFTAKLGSDFTWSWANPPSRDNGTAPPGTVMGTSIATNSAGTRIYIAGQFAGGSIQFGSQSAAIILESLPDPGEISSFSAALQPGPGDYFEQIKFEVISAFGGANVQPGRGVTTVFKGGQVFAQAPARIYEPKPGASVPELVLQNLEEAPPDTDQYDSRRTCVGYSLGDGITADTGTRFEGVIDRDTVIKFHWESDFKLDIFSNVMDESDDNEDAEEAIRTLGNPEPGVGSHWIGETEEVSPTVDGIAQSFLINEVGERFILTSYEGTANIPDSTSSFIPNSGRIQVGGLDGRDFLL